MLALGFLLTVCLAPALASPQPVPMCGNCGAEFEEAAQAEGLPMSVSESTATVRVHDNGSATWVVTNRVNETAADRPRSNAALPDRIARRAITSGRGLPHSYGEDRLTVGAAVVDGRTVTIRFLDRAGGKRHAGVVVVDYLHSKGVGGGWIRNAETFTVVGPPGTTLHNDTDRVPGGGRRPADDGRRVTWTGSTGDRFEADFRDDTYLVFAPAGTPPWRVDLALGLTIAPIWLVNLRAFTYPVGLLYGAMMVGVAVATRAVADVDGTPDRLAAGVAVIGGAGVLLFAVSSYTFLFGALPVSALIYLVTGAVALARPATFRSVRGAFGVGLLGLSTGAGFFGVVSIFTDGVGLVAAGGPIATAARMAGGSIPVAIAPAFGVACTARWDQGTRLAGAFGCLRPWVGALGGYVLAGAIFVPFGEVAGGLAIVGYIALAVFLGLCSFPLAVLAARVWTEQRQNAGAPVDGSDECTGRQSPR